MVRVCRIDTEGVIKRVKTLFRGNKSLVLGFNQFLPPGYRIDTTDEDRFNGGGTGAAVEFSHAVQYVAKIKVCFFAFLKCCFSPFVHTPNTRTHRRASESSLKSTLSFWTSCTITSRRGALTRCTAECPSCSPHTPTCSMCAPRFSVCCRVFCVLFPFRGCSLMVLFWFCSCSCAGIRLFSARQLVPRCWCRPWCCWHDSTTTSNRKSESCCKGTHSLRHKETDTHESKARSRAHRKYMRAHAR